MDVKRQCNTVSVMIMRARVCYFALTYLVSSLRTCLAVAAIQDTLLISYVRSVHQLSPFSWVRIKVFHAIMFSF